MDDDLTKQFRKYENTKELWDALKEKFGGVSLTKLRCLSVKLDTYKKRADHNMKRHLREMANMIAELSDCGHTLSEEQKIQAVIRSLLSGWEHMKLHLIHSPEIKCFDDVVRHLELEEDCLAALSVRSEVNFADSSSSNRFHKKKKNKKKFFKKKVENKSFQVNANVPKKKGKKKLNITKVCCYRCRNKRHFARDCNAPAAKVHDSSMYISYTYVSSNVFLTETH